MQVDNRDQFTNLKYSRAAQPTSGLINDKPESTVNHFRNSISHFKLKTISYNFDEIWSSVVKYGYDFDDLFIKKRQLFWIKMADLFSALQK